MVPDRHDVDLVSGRGRAVTSAPVDELSFLLRDVADGSLDSLNELVSRLQVDVLRLCSALLPSALAEDATQETFLRVWRSAPTFRGESSARTWVLTIARRACHESLRRRRRRDELAAAVRRQEKRSDASEELALGDLVGRLEANRRAAFVLTQLLGLSYEETAEVCGCPVGTIRSRVARARSELVTAWRQAQDQRGGTGDGPERYS